MIIEWDIHVSCRKYILRFDLFLSGHNYHLAHLQHEYTPTNNVISGTDAKYYLLPSVLGKHIISAALSKYIFNDKGFVWFEISRRELYASFHDNVGNIIYEYEWLKRWINLYNLLYVW